MSWTHNLLILGKCKRDDEREFYLRLAHGQKWPSRELERQINGALFERTVLSPPKLSAPLTELHPAAAAVFKDTYLVEFLDLPPAHSEADLRHSLVEQLKRGYWCRFFFQRTKNRHQKTFAKADALRDHPSSSEASDLRSLRQGKFYSGTASHTTKVDSGAGASRRKHITNGSGHEVSNSSRTR